jgi:hypothetical protein
MGTGGVAIEEDAADDAPYYGGVTASLASSIDGEHAAVFVEFVGHTEESFQFVFAVLKS